MNIAKSPAEITDSFCLTLALPVQNRLILFPNLRLAPLRKSRPSGAFGSTRQDQGRNGTDESEGPALLSTRRGVQKVGSKIFSTPTLKSGKIRYMFCSAKELQA
jgi:hypothetical protein